MKPREYKSQHAEKFSSDESLDVMSTDPEFAYIISTTRKSKKISKLSESDVGDVSCDDIIVEGWNEPYQLSLDLVSKDDTIEELRNAIERYKRGYRRLSKFSYRWEELMKSVEENEDIEQLFVQIQMLRKLKGENLG